MKKIVLLFLISTPIFFFLIKANSKPTSSLQNLTRASASSSLVSPINSPNSLQNKVAVPQTFSIPKLRINAQVEAVGMDPQGRMDVPEKNQDVAWYKLGSKPGEKGSAVIAGHLDTVTGAPAVFYYLSKLTPGDEILVADENNKQYKFKVTNTKIYDYNDMPLNEIFASFDKGRLNLITCNGTFDRSSKNYSKRMVVFSELES